MFTVGPYRFTGTDAARTFGNTEAWWSELTRGLDTAGIEAIGERLLAQAAALAPHTAAALGARPAGEIDTALAAVLGGLAGAADHLRADGQLATSGRGTVAQLNRSGGGVPKAAVETVQVGFGGVEGDVQATRVHHGRPWQALCLWSLEVIEAFAAAGHPIVPGGAGENVTVSGLEWSLIRPGVRLRIGEVLCETSLWALPCKNTAFNFLGGEFELMHHERGPVSRMYATVLEAGRIATGDGVELVP